MSPVKFFEPNIKSSAVAASLVNAANDSLYKHNLKHSQGHVTSLSSCQLTTDRPPWRITVAPLPPSPAVRCWRLVTSGACSSPPLAPLPRTTEVHDPNLHDPFPPRGSKMKLVYDCKFTSF